MAAATESAMRVKMRGDRGTDTHVVGEDVLQGVPPGAGHASMGECGRCHGLVEVRHLW